MKIRNVTFATPSISFQNRKLAQQDAVKIDNCFLSGSLNKNPSYLFSQVDILNYLEENDELFDEFLERKGKVTPSEYRDILRNHPRLLIKAIDYYNKINKEKAIEEEKKRREFFKNVENCGNHTTPEIAAKCAFMLKDSFDERFGENKYRIISVGTSPAFATQIMPLMGTEVVFLPITGVREFDLSQDLNSYPKFIRLAHYLEKNNVDNEKINIILDYTTRTGHTMKVVKKILTDLMNLSDKNIEIISLTDELEKANKQLKLLSEEKLENIDDDLNKSRVLHLGNVVHYRPHTSCTTNENEDFEWFDNFSSKFARAYTLCAYEELHELINK